MSKKNMTIEDLARHIDRRLNENEKHTDKKIDEKVEKLARMVANGFSTMTVANNRRFDVLERGQEDIKLRLDNVAYRFELVELQKRVDRLEKNAGIA